MTETSPNQKVDLVHEIPLILENQFSLNSLRSPKDARQIAEAILKLSDFYIANPDQATPWEESWARLAYLSYFLPLNHARAKRVYREIERAQLHQQIDTVIDFGSGLGSLSWVFEKPKYYFVEHSINARKLHQELGAQGQWLKSDLELEEPRRNGLFSGSSNPSKRKTLAFFSYSFTELQKLPAWAMDCDYLLVIEPATQVDGRRLMTLRQNLITQGWHALAPCLHQLSCPLLTQSQGDWCHDRLVFDKPDWFIEIEKHLPIKNNTVTLSYLLMSKQPPAMSQTNSSQKMARTVGDLVHENGKSRQLICQNDQREFLTWMDRHWKKGKNYLFQEIPRGELVDLPENLEKKSNEWRWN